VYLTDQRLLLLIVADLFLDTETAPWHIRVWSAIKRSWPDWLVIGVTLWVIAGGIVGLIMLPGQG
jgi:hypothetical protein